MRSIKQEQIKILNIYVSTNRATKYMKQKSDRTARRNKSKIIVVDFNISFSITDRMRRQKIN